MGSYENGAYGLGGVGNSPKDDSKNIRSYMDKVYTSSYPSNSAYWVQGSIDKRFKVGDQSLWSMIYGDNNYYQSRRFFFNLIRRHLNMICGYQRRNRKSTITIPNQKDTDPLADDWNKVLKWSEDRDGFQEYLSQAFEGSCDTGQTLLHLYPDYTNDPISGDLLTDCVSYNNFLIDPYYRKQDLSDCNFIWRRRWVTKEVAKTLLPSHDKEIDKLKPSGAKDGRFPLQAELLNLNVNQLYTYDEFHYRDQRQATFIIDPRSGEAIEWEDEKDDHDMMLEDVLQLQPWLKVHKRSIPTVKLAIVVAGEVLYEGANLLGIDSYPFVPSLCYYEPDIQSYQWRCQGIIRNLRDAQYLYNMRKVIELDILQSQINSGWIYPIDSITDPKAFRQSGQGFLIPLKAGHLPSEIQRIEPPSIPASMMELSRSLAEDITKISGVNEELLGSATDDKSGILSMLRQGAGLTTLQGIFDKLDYTQRIYGKIRMEAIRKNFSKGKVQSILGHEPSDKFFSNYSQKYSLAVEEGNYSTTQRQMELQQLLHFKEMGIPIPDKTILNAAFITNKQQLLQDMQEQAQSQQQQQQQQAQMEGQKAQAETMVKMSQSKLNMAKVAETEVKMKEINASADHKNMESDLNLVKLAMELEDVQFLQIKNAFELAQAMKIANNSQTNAMEAI